MTALFKGVRRAFGLQLSRFRFRQSREKIISFTGAFTSAKDVLIVMPLDRSQLLNTVFVIDLLRRTFREENLTFVTGEKNQELRRMMPRSQFISYRDPGHTTLFLPPPEVLARVRKKSYDAALDLNLDFLLPSAYICKASDARVRIGFARKGADLFFNFQVQKAAARQGKDAYDRLAECLQKF